MKKQKARIDSLETRARERVLRELHTMDAPNLHEQLKTAPGDGSVFIDMMPGADGQFVSFVIDGRSVWDDLTIRLAKDEFHSQESANAFPTCVELIKLAASAPTSDRRLVVGAFRVYVEREDQRLWKKVLNHFEKTDT